MANTLLITKQTGGYFSFLLNSDYAKEIRSIRNDLIIFGTDCHFKTSAGANLIKLQNIQPNEITIVSGGTFTGFTVDTLWTKLIEIGFFDWISDGGTGTGINRFDDLLDTFKYTGKNGKALRVNESQQKLEVFTVYNYRNFTDLEDTPSVLQANKMVVTNAAGNALEFQDIPEEQPQFLNSFGYFNYQDLATQTTPLSLTTNVKTLIPNDAAGVNTSDANAPYGVTSVYNEVTSEFDFTQLSVGDAIILRLDYTLTTTTANQKYFFSFRLGIGSVVEFERNVFYQEVKTAGSVGQWVNLVFTIDSEYVRVNPAKLYITTDASGSFKNNGYKVEIIRKNINIVDIVTDVEDATASVKGILKLTGDLGGTSDLPTVPDLANKVDKLIGKVSGIGTKFTVNEQGQIVSYSDASISDITSLQAALDAKQVVLISGTNIKTFEGISLLGSGNITLSASVLANALKLTGETLQNVEGGVSIEGDFSTGGTIIADGNITGNSFIKDGGLATEYLMADGSVTTGGGAVDSVNGQTGVVVLDTSDISDTTNKRYVTDSDLTKLSNTSGTNSGNETTTSLGALIGSAGDATPNDTDYVATALTGGGLLKKITWTNVKAFLKTYFDTVYQAILVSGTNIKTVNSKTLLGSGNVADALVKNTSVTGSYNLDWTNDTWRLTLTGNTTFTESNLPASNTTKTVTLHVNGNFSITYPTGWSTWITGTYSGTATINTIVVEYIESGVYKVQISQNS